MSREPEPSSLARRLGWFVLLWGGGVLAVTIVGMSIKLALK
ncbi:MAG: hypothetical protein ABL904_06740 [Hyphomicrobiaceae bacterium]